MLSRFKKWFRLKPRTLKVRQVRFFIPKKVLSRYVALWPQSLHDDYLPVVLKYSFINLMVRCFKIQPEAEHFKMKGLLERLLREMVPKRFTQLAEPQRRAIVTDAERASANIVKAYWADIDAGVEICPCQFPNDGFHCQWITATSDKATDGLQVISNTYLVDGAVVTIKDIRSELESRLRRLGAGELHMAKFDLMIDMVSILPAEDCDYDAWLKSKSLEIFNRINQG